MTGERPRFEVADVVRAFAGEYRRRHRPSAAQESVLCHVAACRTPALGAHVDECREGCGFARISYNSCRDRHCPKCQAPARAAWLSQRLERLLPVPYFHVVFTLPHELNALALRNKAVVYKILFEAASRTLLQLARDPNRLGADIGVTAVLHTWGQNLQLHPHLHCVVTGGGLAPDGSRWIAGSKRYFLPVKVMGRLFRGKFLALLERARAKGRLELAGSTAELDDPLAWAGLRDRLHRKDWVVHAKPPFGGPEQVFAYLGRYTHRVAISNHRIVDIARGSVSFTFRDRQDGGRKKTMTLDAVEFLRRFLLHVLPKRFVRIRHYGLNASRNVHTKLAAARRLLEPGAAHESSEHADSSSEPAAWWERFRQHSGIDLMACPRCGGRLVRRPARPDELATGEVTTLARAPPLVA